MKNILISVLVLLFVSSLATAQQRGMLERYDDYVPTTLDGANSMGSLTMDSGLDDTTATIDLRGYSYAGMTLNTNSATGNDSVAVVFSVSGSADGIYWSAYSTIDSVVNRTTTVQTVGSVVVPDKWMAFPWLRIRVDASAGGNFGENTAATLSFKVIRRY